MQTFQLRKKKAALIWWCKKVNYWIEDCTVQLSKQTSDNHCFSEPSAALISLIACEIQQNTTEMIIWSNCCGANYRTAARVSCNIFSHSGFYSLQHGKSMRSVIESSSLMWSLLMVMCANQQPLSGCWSEFKRENWNEELKFSHYSVDRSEDVCVCVCEEGVNYNCVSLGSE